MKIYTDMECTLSRFPKSTIVLDLTHTSKIHLIKYGSNLTQNSLNVQKFVALIKVNYKNI